MKIVDIPAPVSSAPSKTSSYGSVSPAYWCGSAIQISSRGGVQCLGLAALYSRLDIPNKFKFSIGEGHPARLAENAGQASPEESPCHLSKWWLMVAPWQIRV